MKVVSIIRDRGQLTIPDSIRKLVNWANPMSAISISVMNPDEITIKPHKHDYDRDKIWELLRKSRAIKGKGLGSAAKFIEKDRQSH